MAGDRTGREDVHIWWIRADPGEPALDRVVIPVCQKHGDALLVEPFEGLKNLELSGRLAVGAVVDVAGESNERHPLVDGELDEVVEGLRSLGAEVIGGLVVDVAAERFEPGTQVQVGRVQEVVSHAASGASGRLGRAGT